MESLFIGKNTLIITMSREDTEKYGCASRNGLMLSIREILNEATDGIGFSSAGSTLAAELFLSRDGGCEIFITRTEETDMLSVGDKGKNTALIKKTNPKYCYMFDDTENLLAFCRELTLSELSDGSEIFYDTGKDLFYVLISGETPQAHEFGALLCRELDRYYISEYCTKLKGGSAERFASFAV